MIPLTRPELDISQLPVFALSRVNVTDGNKTQTYASIFNILGIVVRLLEIGYKSKKPNKEEVTDELTQRLSVLTVSEPPWKKSKNENNSTHSRSSAQQNINKPDKKKLALLATNIVKWLEFTNLIKKDIKPSAVFLGRVWTRLYFSLLNASASINNNQGAASIMELYALCVINAFFVEESYFHLADASSIDRTNPTFPVTDEFIKKFQINDINQFPLTRIIATCPLILGFITKSKADTLLEKMKGKNKEPEFKKEFSCTSDSFDKLNEEVIVVNTPKQFKKFNIKK